jgi:hypothetical protein
MSDNIFILFLFLLLWTHYFSFFIWKINWEIIKEEKLKWKRVDFIFNQKKYSWIILKEIYEPSWEKNFFFIQNEKNVYKIEDKYILFN